MSTRIITQGKSLLQQVCMDYGTALRRIRGVKSGGHSHVAGIDLFTQDERDLINTICEDAEKRAKAEYDEARRSEEAKNPPVSSGPKAKRGIGSW